MRKLSMLVCFLGMIIFAGTAIAGGKQSLTERIINHPDVVQMGEYWYMIEIKENLSNTTFDWRFDVRRIWVYDGSIYITHRMEQISVNVPRSSWVIIYDFVDKNRDGTMDDFDQDRFISIKAEEEIWLRVTPMWPDEFKYPKLKQSEILELYKKEMEYWESKL